MAQNYINKIKIDNTEHLIEPTLYVAPTLSSSAYSATLNNFTLVTGATIQAKFATANPANATLNINDTGAKDIFYDGVAITASRIKANHTYTLTYDGTQWQLIGDTDAIRLNDIVKRSLTTSTINTNDTTDIIYSSSAGKFFGHTSNVDWVGLQISSSNDRFQLVCQLVADSNTLLFRQNDNTSVSASNWSAWQQFVHTDFSNVGGAGSATKPVYVATNGKATPIDYTIEANVPADAVFTDTNKYHKTGSWNGLTYTASAVNDADELAFTIPDNYGDTKNPYASKTKSYVLAAPSNAAGVPTFRALVAADIPSLSYLPLAGGIMTGNIRRYYSAASTEPMITALANNQDILLWEVGHGSAAAATATSNHYKLLYKGTGNDGDNSNYLQLIAYKNSDVITVQIDEVGKITLPQMATGDAKTPIYINSNGVITAGNTLADLAYISKGTGSTKFLREDGTWQTALTAHRTYTAVSGKKPTGNQTPGFGSTFDIEQISQDTTGQVSVTERTVKIPDTAASATATGLVTAEAQTLGGGKTLRFTSRVYPLIGASAARSLWYKITFPYSTVTTGSSAQWFMNSFDLHFGGGYSSNPSGVAHVTFYWTRAANNGAWTVGQQAAFIEGTLANKIELYYRIAEPGILYVRNTANVYNGIWIDNLYVDDTAINLNWSTITITATEAITESTSPKLSDYTKITTSYLYNDGGTLKTDGNFEGKYIKGTWLYTSAATPKTSTAKLATIESDNFIYYITPANALKSAIGTTAIGAEKTPVYWNGNEFVAGTALKNLAYKDSLTASDIPDISGTYVKKVTSTDNAIVRFDGTSGQVQDSGLIINDNNMLTIPGGSKVYSVSSVYQSGYVKWATLTISGAYQNQPIVFEISRRGDAMSTIIQVQFQSTSSSDPTLTSFTYYGSCANIYIKKSATSTWDLYASKTENYDCLQVLRYHNPYNSRINVEWKSEHITDAVEDWIQVSIAPIKVSSSNKATAADLTTTTNAIAYYTNTTGTFGAKASANGALYATSANGTLQWGTLPIAQGGTGQTTLAAGIKSFLGALTEATSDMATTDYVVTRGIGNSDNFYIRAVSHIVNSTTVKTALGTDSSTTNQWLTKKGTWSTPTATQVGALPVNYSAPDFSAATTTNGVYPLAGTNPVTNTTEYGGVLQFGASTSNTNYYAAQLVVSAVSGATSPVHAYIRRMTSTPAWSDWTTLLDNKNTTAPSTVPTLSWNTESTVFTLNGTAVKVKAMAKPTYAFTDLTSHPTTLSGYGITNAVQYNGIDNDIGSSATATNAKAYWANNNKVPKGKVVFNYNSSGTEYTTLFSNNNNSYGSILRWGYSDNYIRILRAHPNQTTYNGWYTEDWEKISAGYADSAGKATNDVDGNAIKTTYAKLASPTFTGTPKSETPTSTSDAKMIATKEYVDGILAANDALVYKGTKAGASAATNGGTLMPAGVQGDTYKVSTAGYINGVYCEVGDMIICITDVVASTTSNYSTTIVSWNIIQTSDGTVSTSETSVTEGQIPTFKGTTGKFIQNSSKSFSTATPTSSSTDAQIPTAKAVWAAIDALDVSNISGFGKGKTLATLSETNGKITATFQDISINYLQASGDNRSVATTPNDYNMTNGKIVFQGLKAKATIDNPSTDYYSYVLGLRGWGDSSGGDAHEFAFNNSGINWRHGATTTWSNWEKLAMMSDVVASQIEIIRLST